MRSATVLLCYVCQCVVLAQGQLTSIGLTDLEDDSRFGLSVDLSGAVACISAPYQAINGQPQQGAVYVFDRHSDWLHEQTLFAPDGSQFDRFGLSIAVHGNTLAVGAPGKGSGVVYLYEHLNNSWTYTGTIKPYLLPGHYVNGMHFGFKVDITENYLFVSAPYYLVGASKRESSVFIYARGEEGWEYLQRLAHPQGQPGSLYGYAIAADGNRLIVGSAKSDGGAPRSGCAFLYEPDGEEWRMKHRFIYPESYTHERYGTSVDIHDDRVIIGSMMHVFDPADGPMGAAHIYLKAGNTWFHSGMLTNDVTIRNDFYSHHVAIDGDIAVVSAARSNHHGRTNTGSIHVFKQEHGFWSLKYHLAPDTDRVQEHQYFGGAFALEGKHLLIGSHLEDNTRDDSGNSYIHDLESLVSTEDHPDLTYAVYDITPNPFHNSAVIRFDLPEAVPLRIEAYDVNGTFAGVIADAVFPAGKGQTVTWETVNLATGAYFIQLKAGAHIATIKGVHIQ